MGDGPGNGSDSTKLEPVRLRSNGMRPDDVQVGRPLTAGPFVVREIMYAPGFRQSRHAHAYMGVTLVVAGSIRESAGSREELGGALSIVVKPAGVEHADEVGPRGARTLQIAFAAGAARELPPGEAGLRHWRWLHGDAAASGMLSLLRLTRSGEGASDGEVEARVLDALGTLAADEVASGAAPGWLRQVKESLDDLSSLAAVRELARKAGVHEVSVSRAFRRHYGCTISEYRRRERVRRAASSIEARADHLSRIAHTTGYADHAHLCREFRRTTGMTPSAFRDLAREVSGAEAPNSKG